MNLPAIAFVVLALAQSDTAALVEASKEARARRKSSTTKVITNADVKKADKSKITVRQGVDTTPVEKTPTLMETHEAERAARLEQEAKSQILNETIARLEKELARLEQSYYESNDLNYRDTEIVKRFNETKAKLDEVRNAAVSAAAPQASSPSATGGETPPSQPAETPPLGKP